jgi:hypothetical protein
MSTHTFLIRLADATVGEHLDKSYFGSCTMNVQVPKKILPELSPTADDPSHWTRKEQGLISALPVVLHIRQTQKDGETPAAKSARLRWW